MSSCALAAEAMNHHPDWSNVWNRVRVELMTHDAGGVTQNDLALARRMNEIYGK
jgi:4a-hydroxytetrahydrobiopterin dehydratase